nr:hypothetical protein [Tanacetum cinerariifolium]
MMMKRIGKLEHILADLIQVNKNMEERLDKHGARLYTVEQLDIPQQVSIAVSEVVTNAVDWAMQAPLRNRFRDLSEADMKEILHQRMWESDSYKSHEDHMQLFEALEKSMNRDHSEELAQDLAKARKKKKSRELPKTPPGSPSHQPPPPPPPPASPSRASGAPRASGSAQMPQSPPPPSSTNQSPSKGSAAPNLEMDEDMAPDEKTQSSNDEDIGSAHIPTVNLRQGWWKPFEEEQPTTLEPAWSIRSSDVPVLMNNWASALASNYSPPPEDSLHISFGLKMSENTILLQCMVSLTGGSKDNDSTLTDTYLKVIAAQSGHTSESSVLYESKFFLCFEYKHDYTVIESSRAVIFRDKYEVQMMMRFNEIHKFSDGTLLQIDQALDYRVKEFRINRLNPGLNTRFWTRKDVDRCNAFMFAIQRRLRTRRIFHNLESFVGGRVREGDYRLLRRTD